MSGRPSVSRQAMRHLPRQAGLGHPVKRRRPGSRRRCCPTRGLQHPALNPPQDGRSERWSRLSHKPHIAGETVTVFYRFHPLCGKRAVKLGRRSHRGEPGLMVAAPDGRRYLIPRWMTDPKSAEWAVREVPRLSRAAMSELHGLVAMILRIPVSPETGDCNETSKSEDPAERAGAHATASDRSAEGRGRDGRLVAGGPDRGGDARRIGPDAPGRRRP